MSNVSISVYGSEFDDHFNIAFDRPLEDMCDICVKYNKVSELEINKIFRNYLINTLQIKNLQENIKILIKEKLSLVMKAV